MAGALPSTPSHILDLHAKYRSEIGGVDLEPLYRGDSEGEEEGPLKVMEFEEGTTRVRLIEESFLSKPAAIGERWRLLAGIARRFELADGSSVPLGGSAETVEEALVAACRALEIPSHNARYLQFRGVERSGPLGEGTFVLEIRLWTSGVVRATTSANPIDAGLTRVAYAHARHEVLSDKWPCPREDAALLAAVQLARDGAKGVGDLASVVPARLLKARDAAEWELDVLVELGFRLNDPHAAPESDFLAVLETWDTFGTVGLDATMLSPRSSSPSGTLRVGRRGLQFNNLKLDLRPLTKWGRVGNLVYVEDATPRRFVFDVASADLHVVLSLVDDYAVLDWAEDPPDHRYVRPAHHFSRCQGTDTGDFVPASISSQTYLGSLYDSLVSAVIRPPRSIYDPRRLGPRSFRVSDAGLRVSRRDLTLKNTRGQTLQCSHWTFDDDGNDRKRPCVIFVHANSAARVQAIHYLGLVLSLGATFFAFDCAGSGLSEGDFVSLGWRESRDLHVVTRYLRTLGTVSSLAAWGCSMGAASIIFYMSGAGDTTNLDLLDPPRQGHSSLSKLNKTKESNKFHCHGGLDDDDDDDDSRRRRPRVESLDAVVLDSPYADIHQLAVDLAATRLVGGFSAPWLVAQAVLHFLDSTIQATASFSIQHLKPIDHVSDCESPALFLHAESDALIAPAQLENLTGP
ncbi:hypothetical protein CTAYLR_008524 [Chrysophaeum taylorii]|uniref:FERM central domain-containing protein n=1 Tax=Chrysophaeum taylorii TaxID=2483200 RepID=A0AAD7UL06_9STRA|nr:hypothetical protein CTAYLR_008524 [Chrysophaeum taylorii]